MIEDAVVVIDIATAAISIGKVQLVRGLCYPSEPNQVVAKGQLEIVSYGGIAQQSQLRKAR